MAVQVPESEVSAAYKSALAFAKRRGRGRLDITEALIDSATDAVMWCVQKCEDVKTFRRFATRTVSHWVRRAEKRAEFRAGQKPPACPLSEEAADALESRREKPSEPLLIEDLPDDLAFIVRLYMVDGYTLREIGLLVSCSPNTVDLKLKKAAELLAPGRMKPDRGKNEKRLAPG